MIATELTIQQVERAIRKIALAYPPAENPEILTDIHLRVSPESGDFMAFDDDGKEINRCVVDQWMEYKEDDFFTSVTAILRNEFSRLHELVDGMGILRPYSFVLEEDNDEDTQSAEIYVVDDEDTVIIDGDLMKNLDKDLDDFLNEILDT